MIAPMDIVTAQLLGGSALIVALVAAVVAAVQLYRASHRHTPAAPRCAPTGRVRADVGTESPPTVPITVQQPTEGIVYDYEYPAISPWSAGAGLGRGLR
jgi:hypothetical protein